MKAKSKFLFFTLILLLVALGTVSAVDNDTDSSQTSDIVTNDDISTNNEIRETITNEKLNNQNKIIEKNNEITNDKKSVKSATNVITVNNATYSQFFTNDATTNLIRSGDTINLKGNFYNMTFTVDKSITLTSLDKDAKLYNSSVYVLGSSASNSVVSNLQIINSAEQKTGIHIKDTTRVSIINNTVKVKSKNAFAFAADNTNYSTIKSNYFEASIPDGGHAHSTFVLGSSNYNKIENNTVNCWANGIYLSWYPNGEANFQGGISNHNNITGNTVTGHEDFGSFCYTIQVMGEDNRVSYNTVSGGNRGICTSDYPNNVVSYNDVSALAFGIHAAAGSTVTKNYVHVDAQATGITIDDNVIISENNITTVNGTAIEIMGCNSTIKKNNITTTNGYGIHSKGNFTQIIIEDNKITSAKEGIIFKYQSSNKRINHVKVLKNTITSNAEYAIDFEDAGSKIASEINITVSSSNVLKSSRGTGLSAAYKRPGTSSGSGDIDDGNQTITISSETYNQYFDNGLAKPIITQNATIYLTGTFENLNFTFNKKVHVIGNNCEIINGNITFTGDAHSSTITNVKIRNTAQKINCHGIEVLDVNNVKISNVNIAVVAEYEAFGIFIAGADGTNVSNSKINTKSDYVNDGIMVFSSDSSAIENNNITINQSGVPVQYADSIMFNDRIGIIQEVLHNHGIILIYSSNNYINKNTIKVNSGFTQYTSPTNDCKNSIVGIDIYFDSHRNTVVNNTIDFKSYAPFAYGMGVLGSNWDTSITSSNATDNVFEFNTVKVNGGYFATGFIAGKNSVNTIVNSNNFSVYTYRNETNRGDYVHAITLENSTTSTITNNNIGIVGTSVYCIELFDSNLNTIFNNTITARGTNPYGVAGYASSYNNITNNTFTLRKFDYGTSSSAQHADAIPSGDQGIMFNSSSTRNNISFNKIDTNATCAVKLTNQTRNNYVVENSLKTKTSIGDAAVLNQHTSNVVSNNFLHFVNVTADSVTAKLGDTVDFVAHIETTGIDLKNLRVTFKLGSTDIGTVGVVNNVATLSYQLNSTFWRDTTYPIMVSVKGTNFQNASVQSQATFSKDPEATVVKVANVYQPVGTNATLTANISTASGGKIGTGIAEFYVDDVKIAVVSFRTGVANYIYNIPSNAVPALHKIKVVYQGTNDYLASSGTGHLGIQTVSAITASALTGTIGQSVTFNATVKSGGKNVTSGKVHIYIDDTFVYSKKIVNGSAVYTYTVPYTFSQGNHNLKYIYDGNSTLSPANKTVTFKLNPATPYFSFVKTTVDVGQNANLLLKIDNGLSGTNYYGADGGNVTVKLNGKVLTDANGKNITGTIHNGNITFKFTVPSQLVGSNNISFIYSGDSTFKSATKTYNNAFIVNNLKNTNIELYNLNPALKGSTVKLSGKLLSNGAAVKGVPVTVTVDGKNYTATTYSSGYFTVNHTITSYASQTVKFTFAGYANYASSQNSTTLKVKQPTTIAIYKLSTATKGSTVKLSGKLLSNGAAVKGVTVTVTVGGNNYTATTYSSGYFTVNYTVTSYDPQTVKFTFAGNSNYESKTNSTTLKVKQPTTIELYSMSTVKVGSTIKVSGKLLSNGAGVKNQNVVVKVNNNSYTAKTYSSGYFTINYTVTNVGTNNVTFTYAGSTAYIPVQTTQKFTATA